MVSCSRIMSPGIHHATSLGSRNLHVCDHRGLPPTKYTRSGPSIKIKGNAKKIENLRLYIFKRFFTMLYHKVSTCSPILDSSTGVRGKFTRNLPSYKVQNHSKVFFRVALDLTIQVNRQWVDFVFTMHNNNNDNRDIILNMVRSWQHVN